MSMLCVAVCLQDVDFDSQSQSSYDRALSERGHSQMSSDDTWKGKSNASEYTAFTSTHTHAQKLTYTLVVGDKFYLKIYLTMGKKKILCK